MDEDKQGKRTILIYSLVLFAVLAAILIGGRFIISTPYTARSHFGTAADESGIYLIGGNSVSGTLYKEVFYFDLSAGKIHKKRNLPFQVMDSQAVFQDGTVFIAGGFAQNGYSDALLSFCSNSPKPEITAHFPQPVCYGSLVSMNGRIFYLSGIDGKDLTATVYAVNPSDGTISYLTDIDSELYYSAMLPIGNQLYSFGGETLDGDKSNGVFLWDTETWESSLVFTLPKEMSRTSAVFHNGSVFIFGGWRSGKLNDAYRIDNIQTDPVITRLANLPEPEQNLHSYSINGSIYIMGGKHPDMYRQVGLLRYEPETDMYEPVLLYNFKFIQP